MVHIIQYDEQHTMLSTSFNTMHIQSPSGNEAIIQSTSHSMSEWMSDWLNGLMDEWMNERTKHERTNELTNDWTNELKKMSTRQGDYDLFGFSLSHLQENKRTNYEWQSGVDHRTKRKEGNETDNARKLVKRNAQLTVREKRKRRIHDRRHPRIRSSDASRAMLLRKRLQ